MVSTLASQAGNTGSNPVGGTKDKNSRRYILEFFILKLSHSYYLNKQSLSKNKKVGI